MKRLLEKDRFWLFLIFLLALVQARFLFQPGFYTFSDEPHLANLHQMIRAISGGQLPPRWAPDMSFNFGYPLFNFYYPLPFYLGAFFNLFFKTSLIWSLKLVFFLSLPLSGFALYFLAKKFFSQITAFSAAAVYLFTPYRAVDLYVRGAVGEMWGFVFMPLVLLTFLNLLEKEKSRAVFFASLSLAGLILAHNLAPIIFLPALAFFILIFCLQEKTLPFLRLFFATFLGLALSAYYWLPALGEKKFIQPGTPFNPLDHFPFIKQLILPSWGYGASVWGPTDQLSFQIGIINLVAFLLSFLAFFLLKEKKRRWFLASLILLFLGTVFLMNIRSWPVWQLLPLGEYLQFPWRFLILTTLFTALMVGFTQSLHQALPPVLAALAIALTLSYFQPAKQMRVDDDYYLRRFFINQTSAGKTQALSQEYLNYSEDYLPLTIWTKERPSQLPPKIEVLDPKAQVLFEEKTPTDFEINFNGFQTTLLINSYYFPGWEAKVDGQPTPLLLAQPFGQMKLELSAGQHLIEVNFNESRLRHLADLISLFSLVPLLIFLKKL